MNELEILESYVMELMKKEDEKAIDENKNGNQIEACKAVYASWKLQRVLFKIEELERIVFERELTGQK